MGRQRVRRLVKGPGRSLLIVSYFWDPLEAGWAHPLRDGIIVLRVPGSVCQLKNVLVQRSLWRSLRDGRAWCLWGRSGSSRAPFLSPRRARSLVKWRRPQTEERARRGARPFLRFFQHNLKKRGFVPYLRFLTADLRLYILRQSDADPILILRRSNEWSAAALAPTGPPDKAHECPRIRSWVGDLLGISETS